MKRVALVLIFILSIVLGTVCFAACLQNSGGDQNNTDRKVVSISANVPDKDFVIGQIDYSEINVMVHYDTGEPDTVALTEEMINITDLPSLSKVGRWSVRISYLKHTTTISLNMVESSSVFYTVSIIGGYVSAINGVELIEPEIPSQGNEYIGQYREGTVLTLHWIDVQGKHFDYWELNSVPGEKASIITVTVNENMNFRAYSGTVVYTISFVTGFDDINVSSKTTDMINSSDIETITADGYVFLGWTTDKISETQAHSGYTDNIVKFPYNVTRDAVFYAAWTPIGLEYRVLDDGYAVSRYSGSIQNLIIPEQYLGRPVVKIDKGAFSNIEATGKNLLTVYLPSSVSMVDDGAFKDCMHLEEIEVSSENASLQSVDGVLYTADGKTLIAYPAARVDSIYNIQDEAERISEYAFYDAAIGAVVVGNAVKSIGSYAFYSKHIVYVNMYNANPSGLSAGANIFNDAIAELCVESVKKNGFCEINAFAEKADRIIMNESELSEIGIFTTQEADGLLSKTVYRVIKEKYFDNKEKSAEIIAVSRNVKVLTMQISLDGYDVTSIGKNAFASCDLLENVKFPAGSRLERIDDNAFGNIPWTKQLKNNSIIVNFVFYKYLGSSETVTITSDIEKIANGAFRNNSKLKYLDITNNAKLEIISDYAFYNCTAFKGFVCDSNPTGDGVYLKMKLSKIGAYAFYRTAITNVILQTEKAISPSNFNEIGEFAFAYCDKLVSFELSEKMSDLDSSAFVGCYSLEKFKLLQNNKKYEVYDGILYEKENDEYSLCVYPAGKLNAVYEASSVRNYAISMDFNENKFLESPEDNVSIGTVYFNGIKYVLNMSVYGYGNADLLKDVNGKYIIKKNGELLTETTNGYWEEGRFIPNGEKYYNIILKDSNVMVPLLYDGERKEYYFDIKLNVTSFGPYSLYYSNIAALEISDSIKEIHQNAINIPGLTYALFDSVPAEEYSSIFLNAAPKYIILPESMGQGDTNIFFGRNDALRAEKLIMNIPYEFFYSYDAETNSYDRTILYAYETEASGDKVRIARTVRNNSEIYVPENVVKFDGSVAETVASKTQQKSVLPYAFFGAAIKTVYLSYVNKLESNAFSMAYNMTKLDLSNGNFITDLGENVFGEKFNNGLFIYDNNQRADLYQESKQWNMSYFEYIGLDGVSRRALKYLIEGTQGAFAVVVYRNELHEVVTVDLYYGAISSTDVAEMNIKIDKAGYDINKWVDNEGVEVMISDTYEIPYNQILECNFVAQKYKVYITLSAALSFDESNFERENYPDSAIAGLKKYSTILTYDELYDITPQGLNGKYIFYKIKNKEGIWENYNGKRVNANGVWNITSDNGQIELWAEYGYKVTFDANSDNFEGEYMPVEDGFVFQYESYNFGIPNEGLNFVGWALDNEGQTMITDASGICESWQYTSLNEYTIYAIWEN